MSVPRNKVYKEKEGVFSSAAVLWLIRAREKTAHMCAAAKKEKKKKKEPFFFILSWKICHYVCVGMHGHVGRRTPFFLFQYTHTTPGHRANGRVWLGDCLAQKGGNDSPFGWFKREKFIHIEKELELATKPFLWFLNFFPGIFSCCVSLLMSKKWDNNNNNR